MDLSRTPKQQLITLLETLEKVSHLIAEESGRIGVLMTSFKECGLPVPGNPRMEMNLKMNLSQVPPKVEYMDHMLSEFRKNLKLTYQLNGTEHSVPCLNVATFTASGEPVLQPSSANPITNKVTHLVVSDKEQLEYLNEAFEGDVLTISTAFNTLNYYLGRATYEENKHAISEQAINTVGG
jgi:hypothetical protein